MPVCGSTSALKEHGNVSNYESRGGIFRVPLTVMVEYILLSPYHPNISLEAYCRGFEACCAASLRVASSRRAVSTAAPGK